VRLHLTFVGPFPPPPLMSHRQARRISRWFLCLWKHSVLQAKNVFQVIDTLLHIKILLKYPVQFRAVVISLCKLHLREVMLRLTLQPVHCSR
jgi:hypothetical protein